MYYQIFLFLLFRYGPPPLKV